MIARSEKQIVRDSLDEFKQVIEWVMEETDGKPIQEVERGLHEKLLRIGNLLLRSFVEKEGDGYVGEDLILENGTTLGYVQNHAKTYFSIFGKLQIDRTYYWKEGLGEGVFPLDERLSLPQRSYSYVLQEWAELLGTKTSFDEVTALLEKMLRINLSKRPLEVMSREVAKDVGDFYEEKDRPVEAEGEIVVAAVDGKGIPMRQGTDAVHKVRLKRGEKRSVKKQATVSAVYCTEAQPRAPEDIVKELRGNDEGDAEKPDPPTIYVKEVRGTLEGKEVAFERVVRDVARLDPEGTKKRVAIMDGDRGLQKKARHYFKGYTLILDIFHVLEYLWKAAHVLHKEGTPEAEEWVRVRLLAILQGRVGRVIGGLRQTLTKRKLRASKREVLQGVVNYMHRNRRMMQYDEYLAAGFPIGSGAVEGACRHLVRDRFELAGMRWTQEGAQAMLDLRATALNDDWEAFWEYHIAQEQNRLYGHRKAA